MSRATRSSFSLNTSDNENAVNPIGRTFIARFASNDLHGLEYKGEPCVLAFEQADAMGAERGSFTDHIRRLADAGEMIDGEHRHVVTDPAEMRALRDAYRLPDNLSASGVIADRTPNVVLLTRQGAILAAMTSRAPRAREFRAWAVEVLYNVLTTGKHEEPGATPKPLTPPAELRRIGDRLWRAGKRDEATVCYLQAGEISLGRSFAAQAPAPAPVQVALPLQKPAEVPAEVTPETALWSAFVARWFKRFDATAIVHAGRLLEVVGDLFPLGDVGRDTKISRLNRILWDKAHQPIAGYQLEYRRSTRSGWSLVKV